MYIINTKYRKHYIKNNKLYIEFERQDETGIVYTSDPQSLRREDLGKTITREVYGVVDGQLTYLKLETARYEPPVTQPEKVIWDDN